MPSPLSVGVHGPRYNRTGHNDRLFGHYERGVSASRSKGMVTSRRALQASVAYCSGPYFLSRRPAPRIVTPGEAEMDYEFDPHPRILLFPHRNGRDAG